ncbi:hypothetical protein SAMN05421823_102553 [Catalinimonas alkaloidigena]|uniref:Uncharacterized protein n=1 Tax=Catalinimonas alkaloidigena TaxID=1075417 RepID=A0A1G9BAG4_9BACT|nr:hypothetical protein [Catalinimonas alkaloidigena]SDK36050.1 hypothetical protein SAMN05421823_102553 [Catalinimonas alkaloidigena]
MLFLEMKAEIEQNRKALFGEDRDAYQAVGPFVVSPGNRPLIWGDLDVEDFEIRLYAEEVRWYTLQGQALAVASPVDLVGYCNDLFVLVTHTGLAHDLRADQLDELGRIQYRLIEAKMWAGQLYLAAKQKIEAEKDSFTL